MPENTQFQMYLDNIDPADPEWLKDRLLRDAATDANITGLELKQLYRKAYPEVS